MLRLFSQMWIVFHPNVIYNTVNRFKRIHWGVCCFTILSMIIGVTSGGRVPPRDFLTGKFLLTYREKRGKEKREREKMKGKRRNIVENCKLKEGKLQNEERTYLFFCFFFVFVFVFCFVLFSFFVWLFFCFVLLCFFYFSLFKTTKICFGCTKMEIIYREKALRAGKKYQEKWLCPLRKLFLLRPCLWSLVPLQLRSLKKNLLSFCTKFGIK